MNGFPVSAKRIAPLWAVVAFRLGLGVSVALAMVRCKDEPAWKQNKFKKHELSQTNSDPQLPDVLWRRIESVYTGLEVKDVEPKTMEVENGHEAVDGAGHEKSGLNPEAKSGSTHEAKPEGEGGGGTHAAAELEKGVLPTEFAPLKVYLVEKNHGVLHGLNHEIVFGRGGGEMDLQDFVDKKKGSFYFVAEFMPDVPIEKGSPGRKVFFLSNSVRRRNQAETIGNGCRNYYDITSSFERAMGDTGYALNTTDNRHVSALAGTFFFAVKNEGKLFLAQLTIKDSSQRSLQCRR